MRLTAEQYRQLGFPRLTEDKFQTQVIQAAQALGWRVAHFRKARTKKGWRTPVQADGKGFPDLLLCRGSRCMTFELKIGTKKPTLEQTAWLRAFNDANVPAFVFRPEDWAQIEELLR